LAFLANIWWVVQHDFAPSFLQNAAFCVCQSFAKWIFSLPKIGSKPHFLFMIFAQIDVFEHSKRSCFFAKCMS